MLNWNGERYLDKLYETLIPNLDKYIWHIKDNKSSDGSIAKINSWKNPNINLIAYPHNQDSFAFGMNYLFAQANPSPEDDILVMNNDLYFGDDVSIRKMQAILNNDPDVGVVGARLLYMNSNLLQHAGVIFSSRYNSFPFHYRPGQESDANSKFNREFQAVTGAMWLTKAKYYSKIGTNQSGHVGLPETYIWSFEDISASLSIKYEQNKKIIYCGETLIYHEESGTLKKNKINQLYTHHNGKIFKKQWEGRYKLDLELYEGNKKFNIYSGPKR